MLAVAGDANKADVGAVAAGGDNPNKLSFGGGTTAFGRKF
jgi:hypothetical protein